MDNGQLGLPIAHAVSLVKVSRAVPGRAQTLRRRLVGGHAAGMQKRTRCAWKAVQVGFFNA